MIVWVVGTAITRLESVPVAMMTEVSHSMAHHVSSEAVPMTVMVPGLGNATGTMASVFVRMVILVRPALRHLVVKHLH